MLEHLDLQDNTFGEHGSTAAAEVLPLWPRLHTLNLSDCHLATEGDLSPVVEALAEGSNPRLRTLQLQNNNFDAQSSAVLSRGIDSALRAIVRLELQWNDFDEDDEDIANLASVLAMVPSSRTSKRSRM